MPPFNNPGGNIESENSDENKSRVNKMVNVSRENISLRDKSSEIDTLRTVEKAHEEVQKLINRIENNLGENVNEQKETKKKLEKIQGTCEVLKERLDTADKTTVEAKLCYRFLHYLGLKENELKEVLGEEVGPKNKTTSNKSQQRTSPESAI